MNFNVATEAQKAGQQTILDLMKSTEITREQVKELGLSSDYKLRYRFSTNIFKFTDSRQLDGVYQQLDGKLFVIYCAFGWLRTYFLMTESEYHKADSAQVEGGNYYEF